MRIIEKRWVDLYEGYKSIRSFEERLESEWGRAIQVARRREEHAIRTRRTRTRNIARVIFLVILFFCVLLWTGMYFLPDSRFQFFLYSCLLVLPGMIAGIVYLFHLDGAGSNIRLDNPPSMDLVEPWWKVLRPSNFNVHRYGDTGEIDFLESLAFLDHTYIAVWGLLTSAKIRSDTDVLLLGPNGIWIFEVKYWNGTLSKTNGVWTAERRNGMKKTYENGPDDQWLEQRKEILKTIQLRLGSKPWVANLIKGGVVFAHEDAKWGQISGHWADYGRPGAWRKRIKETEPVKDFGIHDRLSVLDALTAYANLHEREALQIASAKEAADRIYNKAVLDVRKYVSDRVKK